ncbi:MAG: nuclear transport factor 2 family protein [Actinomycetota bacterium]|nr:nuclear transport factor 2 family protein [Actinomycetota bacterium]
MTDWVEHYLEAWNSHDGSQVAAFMAEDVTYEDLSSGAVFHGRGEVQGYVQGAHEWSADYRFSTVTVQEDGRRYAMEWEMRGTDTGGAGGFAATGKAYRIRGASVGRLDPAGLVVENRDYWNLAAYLVDVGLLELPDV